MMEVNKCKPKDPGGLSSREEKAALTDGSFSPQKNRERVFGVLSIDRDDLLVSVFIFP